MPQLVNTRYERFCQLVAPDKLSHDEAYRRSGFNPKTPESARVAASRLLQKAEVQERIRELRSEVVQGAIAEAAIDKAWVLGRLRTVVERSMNPKPILDRDGFETGMWTFNPAGANKALHLIGQELGMFQGREEDAPESGLPSVTDIQQARARMHAIGEG